MQVLTLVLFFESEVPLSDGFGMFRTAPQHGQSNQNSDNASDVNPDCLIGRRSGKEPGNVGAERVCGVKTYDDEDNAAHEQSQRKKFTHDGLAF
jgi:hypothetical protein